MRKRNAKRNAVKLDIGDIKYLHEIMHWAFYDAGIFDAKQFRRADRWVDKPWPSAWSSYACASRTAEQAWDEGRQLVGAAVKAWMRNDRRHIDVMLVNHDTDNTKDHDETKELMSQQEKRNYKLEVLKTVDGFRVTTEQTRRMDDAGAHITYGQWNEFCQMTSEAADSGDWDPVLKHQRNDYYNNGVMVPAKPWLEPYDPRSYIEPKGIYVQKPGAFERIKARELAKENQHAQH